MEYTTPEIKKKIQIYLGNNILPDLKTKLKTIDFDKIIIITDSNVFKFWGKDLAKAINGFKSKFFIFKAGEASKNFSIYRKLCNDILDQGITKKTLIIAFGGGVVGNISGLIAATLYRGIKFIHIPTTIMAQADSTTGGKQAINTKHGKNTVGTFYEPEFIFIDSQFLKTLPEKQVKCGISECIKHALCQDDALLKKLKEKNQDLDFLGGIIEKIIILKLNIIKKDRKEINEGKILVYGHTLGHAIETLSKGKLNHGEAISIGMCCVATISNALGYLDEKDKKMHYEIFKNWNLPTNIPRYIKINQIINQLNYDKKITDSRIELILLRKIGQVLKINNKVGTPITEKELKLFLKSCF